MTDTVGFGRALTERAEAHPHRVAVSLSGAQLTYAGLESSANQLGRVLIERGVHPGEVVAIVLPTSLAYIELVFAVWKIGAVPLPLNPRLPDGELRALLDLAGARLVVGESGDSLEELRESSGACSAAPHDDIANDPWKAIATGGSTGRPKLIVDGANGPAGMAMAGGILGLRADQIQLHTAPLWHNGPFVMALGHITMGGTVMMQPRFDASAWLDAMERERVGWAYVVPTMLHRLSRLPEHQLEGRDLSALEVLFHTAGPCPPWLKRWAIEYFGATRVLELYGATEGGAAGSTLIRGDEWLDHPGSVGRPLAPGTLLKIGDDAGTELPVGQVGLVWMNPVGGLSSHYRGAELSMTDGYYSVGDLGWVDDAGYLYLADRRTDMVVSGGVNIFPAEVEAALLEHPSVADAVVVGVPDDEWGNRVHAIVQLEQGASIQVEGALAEHCREALAGHKVPRSWEVVSELPRDPSGKIRRGQLRCERIGTQH